MNIVTRAEWGAREPFQPYTNLVGSEGELAHHTGDGVARDPATTDYPAMMRQIQNSHMAKGWNDFAYGHAVGGGRIFMGRGFGVVDAADLDRGYLMHSVLWLGDSTVNEIPDQDMALVWAVFDEHNRIYGKKFEGGHRDVNPTGCPGDNIYSKLQQGRSASNAVQAFSTIKPRSPEMNTIINSSGGRECFALRSNGEVWNQWQELPAVTFSAWNKTLDGDRWETLAKPLLVGKAVWLNLAGDYGFGFLNMTAIQSGPGEAFVLHVTNELNKFFAGLK